MLTVTEVPDVHPGPGQVRIVARATSVNPVDWKRRSGVSAARMPPASWKRWRKE